jgi:plasmid stability protein
VQASGAAPAAVAAAVPDARVRPDDQRSRDAEARRILEAELRREEARLNDALKASGSAKPGERVGADAAQIRRAESDIEAIRRELGRLR